MFRLFCAVCILSFTAVPAFAEAHWLEVKTQHFTVLTDGSDRQLRHTAAQLERMQSVFARLLPNASDDPGSRIVVLALRDRKGFQALEPAEYLSKTSLELAGYFLPGEDRNYILLRLDSQGEHPFATVYHEYTHYVVRHSQILPLWLNEGFAQFYQNTDFHEHDVTLGQPDANSILFLRQQRLLPLATLFAVDHTSPYYHEENKGNIFYAESWALTHFLMMSDFGKPNGRLHQYTLHLLKGETPLVAAQQAFGDLTRLQQQLEGYIGQGDYKALTMKVNSGVDETSLTVTEASPAETDALRADVLLRTGRLPEAAALAQAALQSDPQSAQAEESLGLLELRKGDQEEARKHFARAVALHSEDFLTWYHAASLAMLEGSADTTAVPDELAEAIRLNPQFAPAYEALVQYHLMHRDKLEEAQSMAVRAVTLEPGNLDYRLNAAEVRMARNDVPEAVNILEATLKLAKTPEDKERVNSRLRQVRDYQTQLERYKQHQSESTQTSAVESSAVVTTTVSPDGPGRGEDTRASVSRSFALVEPAHKLPEGPPTGRPHTLTGTVTHVGCFAPKGMQLELRTASRSVSLYSNDMYKVKYASGNFTPKDDLNPCLDFSGLKATVVYGAVDDPTVAGQIISMTLNH